jgi:hypothetical protein
VAGQLARSGKAVEALMEAVRHCSLGQISEAFFQADGQYRRHGWHRGDHRRRIGW